MIEVNNFTKLKVDMKILKKLAERVLKGERRKIELSVSLVSPAEIGRLNKKYRKIGKPTDVLSFTYKDFGEAIICPQVVKENAKKYRESFKAELARVLIHGILHILGYDHEVGGKKAERMIKKEEYFCSAI